MAKQFDREEIIEELINNVEGFDESDRDTLDKFNDETLSSFVDNDDDEEEDDSDDDYEEVEEDDEEEVTENMYSEDDEEEEMPAKKKKGKKKMANNSANDADAWLRQAPPEIRTVVTNAMKRERAEKDKLVKTIVANENNVFTREFLSLKSTEELEGIVKLVGNGRRAPTQSYVGANVPMTHNSRGSRKAAAKPLVIPVMNFDSKSDDE